MPKSIKAVSFIPALATIRELTSCQARDTPRAWRYEIHSSSSNHERSYILWSQECHKSIKAVRFITTPATMRELTNCQARNAPWTSRLSDSSQLQPPWENLPTVKPRMPQEHQDSIRFIPAPATIREPTNCQAKNATRASTLSDSFQL